MLIICIFILFSYKASNISAATPVLFAIPTPMIEILDKLSKCLTSLAPILSRLSFKSFIALSKSAVLMLKDRFLFTFSPKDCTITSTLISLSANNLNTLYVFPILFSNPITVILAMLSSFVTPLIVRSSI